MQSIHILLIEDNEGDILLTTELLEDYRIRNTLTVTHDGHETIDFLNQCLKVKNILLPDLILLDINLPRINGMEVLSYIKENEHLKHIPVFMLSTSATEIDMQRANERQANGFLTKPLTFESLILAIIKNTTFHFKIHK
jgi:CheY-like chemotaxis protein